MLKSYVTVAASTAQEQIRSSTDKTGKNDNESAILKLEGPDVEETLVSKTSSPHERHQIQKQAWAQAVALAGFQRVGIFPEHRSRS